jgi:hypothetical protein
MMADKYQMPHDKYRIAGGKYQTAFDTCHLIFDILHVIRQDGYAQETQGDQQLSNVWPVKWMVRCGILT